MFGRGKSADTLPVVQKALIGSQDVTSGSRSRFTGTILGIVCWIGAISALTDGDRQEATMGFILGAGIIVVWEWLLWRERTKL